MRLAREYLEPGVAILGHASHPTVTTSSARLPISSPTTACTR